MSTFRVVKCVGILLSSVFCCAFALASPVTVVQVQAQQSADCTWRFAVTLDHADTGWDHYANRWDVVSEDHAVLYGTRVLHHPHVNEMPFTRSLSRVEIPEGITTVVVRGYDTFSVEPSGERVVVLEPSCDPADT